MKKYFFVLISLVAFLQLPAQDDDVNEILDKLSKKISSYKCFYFEYTVKTEDIQLKTSDLQYGKVLTKGKNFKLSTKDIYLYCNSTTQWQYLKAENEVVISTVDSDSDDFMTNPIGFITGDRKNFKQKLKNEVMEDGINLTEIDFYPRDLKTPYAYIRVRINEKKQLPYSIKYIGKDGVHYTVKINNCTADIEMPDDSEFVFEPSKYQNITVVDLRE